ncbi:hypothetical protein Tco_0710579 [Tanacetum coccineum]
MIKTIDQQLFERRLMRNLEKFVEGREYGNDFRCLNRRNDFVILCPSLYQVFIPTVPARPEGLPWDIPIDSLDVLGQSSRIRRKALPMLPHMYGRFSGKAKLKNLYDLNNAGREKLRDRNWKLRIEQSVRWITCGYPWPELEGKGFGMIPREIKFVSLVFEGSDGYAYPVYDLLV